MKKRETAWQSRAHRVWFGICTVCLSLYIAYVTYLSQSGFLTGGVQTAAALCAFAALSVALCRLLPRGCERLAGLSPAPQPGSGRRVFWAALAISAVIFGCAFAACWPGGVSYDASNQWRQAHSGEFNNWHPVFHTLLIWLVTRVRDSYPFAVCMQIAAFSAAMAYLTATLNRRGVPAWLALGAHALVCASLPVRNTLMYLGKDSAMTAAVLVVAAQTVHMLHTRGVWLKRPRNAVCFGLTLAAATLLRHNAILWTLPLLICALLCFPWGRRGAALAAGVTVLTLVLVRGPLYGALDVVYPDNTTEESVGIPMTILWDVRAQAPEVLDGETATFLSGLAEDGEWGDVYQLHRYNSIKFTYDRELIAGRSVTDILSMAGRAALAEPRLAFETVNAVTGLVWDVTGQNRGYETVSNSGDLPLYGRATLNRLGQAALAVIDAPLAWTPVRWLTENIGAQLLMMLLVALWALRRRGVDVLALALPVLCYDLGTMLLLCGDDARFFQCSMAVCIPCMLAMLYLPMIEEA